MDKCRKLSKEISKRVILLKKNEGALKEKSSNFNKLHLYLLVVEQNILVLIKNVNLNYCLDVRVRNEKEKSLFA